MNGKAMRRLLLLASLLSLSAFPAGYAQPVVPQGQPVIPRGANPASVQPSPVGAISQKTPVGPSSSGSPVPAGAPAVPNKPAKASATPPLVLQKPMQEASPDARTNPFLPFTTKEEEQKNIERLRIQEIVREMLPEIRSNIQQDLMQTKQAAIDEATRKASDIVKSSVDGVKTSLEMRSPVQGGLGGLPSVDAGSTGGVKIPEGARFIGCVNKKALYLDKSGNRITHDGNDEASHGCSR